MEPVAIVGGGAVAQSLGRALRGRGAPVVAVAARHPERARAAAAFVGAGVRTAAYAELPGLASHLIVAVSDEAIEIVGEQLAAAGWRTGVAVHTCGARGPDALAALRTAGAACGVLHPLQTLPSAELGAARLQGITFGVGGDPAAVAWAETLVTLLNGRALHVAPDGFPAYHAAAALAGNAVPALLDAAITLMEQAGVAPDAALEALTPLCRASAGNATTVGPVAALTGPVARGDADTILRHARALAGAPPDVVDLYVAVSRRLLDLARRRGLDQAAARRVEQAIGAALRAPASTLS